MLALSPALASAARADVDVGAAVADLKAALADLQAATTYYDSDGAPGESSLSGSLSDFTGTLKLKRGDGRNVLAAYMADTKPGERRKQIRAILDIVKTTTAVPQDTRSLRDDFFYDFINTIRKISGNGPKLRAQLTQLFGARTADNLIDRYRMAVSRTR